MVTVVPSRPRLGLLYPGHAAEDDYRRLAQRVRARPVVELVTTAVGEDAHRIDALRELGSTERLAAGADRFTGEVDAVMWACTSGSFVLGWDGARRQADTIGERLGAPASSTSFAFVEAVHAVGTSRVAVAATYPQDVADAFASFLAAGGVDVVALGVQGIVTAAEVATFGHERVRRSVAAADHPDAGAVLVPDTALHTVEVVDRLEADLGKPVLTANQVTMWHALRLAGVEATGGPGMLFRCAGDAPSCG